jgi:hypothetical protein
VCLCVCSRVLNPSSGKGVWGDTFSCVCVCVCVCLSRGYYYWQLQLFPLLFVYTNPTCSITWLTTDICHVYGFRPRQVSRCILFSFLCNFLSFLSYINSVRTVSVKMSVHCSIPVASMLQSGCRIYLYAGSLQVVLSLTLSSVLHNSIYTSIRTLTVSLFL